MRAIPVALPLLAALLAVGSVRADESVAAASEPGEDKKEFVIPDGFREKKRGKFTVYCRKETVMGTRVPAEKCYDENGIRALAQELRENREKVDQLRRICGSQAACGSN
jgi:hypothetical protein